MKKLCGYSKKIIAYILMVTIIGVMTQTMTFLYAAAEESAAAPQVVSVSPEGSQVEKVAVCKVEFDTVMDRTTLTSENIVIETENGIVSQTAVSVYDSAYVFMCDFEADTTYTVTVSADVKSAEGIALLEEYAHTFTTAEELTIVENVSPKNDESYFYEKSGAFGTVSNAYGGNAGKYWANNASVSKVWFGVDLGKAYDIAYISYVPGFPSESVVWANNISIQVSNDSDFSDYETLALTPTLSACDKTISYMAFNDTEEEYRYVRLFKSASYMALADFLVYAYPGAPTVTNVTPSGDSVTKAAICKVEFDSTMDISTLTSENITVTDEEGLAVEQKEISAYDSAYTFICDFEADTTYTVTVSSDVKSSAGINAETYTHTFTTADELAVAENVSPTNDESYFYTISGAMGKVSNAYGGNAGAYWANNANVSKVSFGVDLGKKYDIAYIEYAPGFPSQSAGWGNKINIQVSNVSDFSDYETLALTPTLSAYDGSVRYIAANDTEEKYQYVRLFKSSQYMALADFLVYAYPDMPNVTSISPVGENVKKTATCKVSFDAVMDRTTLTSENIVVTDENGNEVEQKKQSAYDTEYVFMCDFKASTTYKISVSKAVKSKEGVRIEKRAESEFTTSDKMQIIKDITPQKTSVYSVSSGGSEAGSIDYIYNKNGQDEWTKTGDVGPAWLQVDLLEAKTLSHIILKGKKSAEEEIEIQASNNSSFSEYDELCAIPAAEPDEAIYTEEYIAANTKDKAYRYVRIFSEGDRLTLNELEIFMYDTPYDNDEDVSQLVNVGKNKPVTYNENLGIYGNGNASAINDGDTTSYKYVAFNPSNSSKGELAFFEIDLLKSYNISEINVFTRGDTVADTKEVTIYGSNSKLPTEKMDVLYVCKDGFPVSKKSTIDVGDKYYRYIRFEKAATGHFVLCEAEIIANTSTNYKEEWNISHEAGEFTAELSNIEYFGEKKKVTSVVAGYDENGHMDYFDMTEFDLINGDNNFAEKTALPDGIENICVSLIDNTDNFKSEFRPIAHCADEKSAKKAETKISDGDVATFVILKSGCSFSQIVSENDILYYNAKTEGNEGMVSFGYDFQDIDGSGTFYGRLIVTHLNGNTTKTDYVYYHHTQADVDRMVNEFRSLSADGSGFAEKFKYYTEIEPYFVLDDIPELKNPEIYSNIGSAFAEVKNLKLSESGNTIGNMIDALKLAYIRYASFNNIDSEVLDKYGDVLSGYDEKIYDSQKVLTMLHRLKDNVKDEKTFTETSNNAFLYSLILDTSAEQTADACRKNEEAFGINIDYAADNGITVTEVASKINTKNPEKYIGVLGETFISIVDEILETRNDSNSKEIGGSRGSGGGAINVPINRENDNVAEEIEKKQSFDDIESVAWAKESIEFLYEKGVISGVDGKNFAPEREIKREEFAKMIFLAFNIKTTDAKEMKFDDCEKEGWYYRYVEALYNRGIINGMSENMFGTGENISRQDVAVIFMRIAENYDKYMMLNNVSYADTNEISEYASDAVRGLSSVGIINGFDDGTFKPKASLTRAQAAVMIHRMLQYLEV